MAMGAYYSFELIFNETCAPQFNGHYNYFLASVKWLMFQFSTAVANSNLFILGLMNLVLWITYFYKFVQKDTNSMVSLGLEFEPTSQANGKNAKKSLNMSPKVHSKVISDAIAKQSNIIVEPNQEEESKISRKKK